MRSNSLGQYIHKKRQPTAKDETLILGPQANFLSPSEILVLREYLLRTMPDKTDGLYIYTMLLIGM